MKNTDFGLWAKAAGIRCIRTVCQSAAAVIGTAAIMSQVDWKLVISTAALAGILSVLTSLGGLPECPCGEDKKDSSK